MEPMVGIEPTTYGLRNRCSTTELHWRDHTLPMTDGEFCVKRRRSKRRPNRSWPKVITGLNAVVKQAMASSRRGPLARLAVSLVRGRRNYLSCALGGEVPSCNLSSVGPLLLQTGGIWMGRRVQMNVAQLQSCPATIPA